jgi:hypothetical protein
VKLILIIILALVLIVPATALAQNQSRYIPLTFRDTVTGDIVKPLPFANGVPLCHDPLYEAGLLGSTCHDEGDEPTTSNQSQSQSKWVGNDPNDDCNEECESLNRFMEGEDKLRESIREAEESKSEGGNDEDDIPGLFEGNEDDGDQEVEAGELMGN